MRTWFGCVGCGAEYLPPESLSYPSLPDLAASPVHCGARECEKRAESVIETSGIPPEVFRRMALAAARAADRGGDDGDESQPVRSSARRARGGRAAAGPGSARSRLS